MYSLEEILVKEALLKKLAEYAVFTGSGRSAPLNYGKGIVSIPTSRGGLAKDYVQALRSQVFGSSLDNQDFKPIRKFLVNPKNLRENPVISGHSRGGQLLDDYLTQKPQLRDYIKKRYKTQFVGMGRPFIGSKPSKSLDMDLVFKNDLVSRLGTSSLKSNPKVLNLGLTKSINPHSSTDYVKKLTKLVRAVR